MNLLDLSHNRTTNRDRNSIYEFIRACLHNCVITQKPGKDIKDIKIVSEIEKDVIIEAHENKLHKSLLIYYQMQLIIHLRIMRLL